MSIKALKEGRSEADSFVEDFPWQAPLTYICIMTACIGLTLPGATFLNVCAGVFFVQPQAALFAYIGNVCGTCLCYLVWRFVLGDAAKNWLTGRSQMFSTFEKGFREASTNWGDTVLFLVFVRYVAFFPSWLVNGGCAILDMGFWLFAITTAATSVAGALLYTLVGSALADTLDSVPDDAAIGKVASNLGARLALAPWANELRMLGVGGFLENQVGISLAPLQPGKGTKDLEEYLGFPAAKLILILLAFCAIVPLVVAIRRKSSRSDSGKKNTAPNLQTTAETEMSNKVK